ncbi:hypothetical protein D3C74_323660 [compost metagenome]
MVVNAKKNKVMDSRLDPKPGNTDSIAACVYWVPSSTPGRCCTIKSPPGPFTLYIPVNKTIKAVDVQTKKVSTYTENA